MPKGRPRKAESDKAKQVTITLWPDDLKAVEQLQRELNKSLPVDVSRSALARVAFSFAVSAGPDRVKARLRKLRR